VRYSYKILVIKAPERSKRILKYSIKDAVEEIWCEGVDWIYLVQSMVPDASCYEHGDAIWFP
jgi:hypothetical protein